MLRFHSLLYFKSPLPYQVFPSVYKWIQLLCILRKIFLVCILRYFHLFLHNLSSFLKGCVYVYVRVCVHACICGWVGGMGVRTCVQLLTAWLGCCDPNLQQPWALVTAMPSLQLLHPDSWCGSLYSRFLPLHHEFKIRPAESWLCPFQWLLFSKVSGSVVC